jgi:hypothetical protein
MRNASLVTMRGRSQAALNLNEALQDGRLLEGVRFLNPLKAEINLAA